MRGPCCRYGLATIEMSGRCSMSSRASLLEIIFESIWTYILIEGAEILVEGGEINGDSLLLVKPRKVLSSELLNNTNFDLISKSCWLTVYDGLKTTLWYATVYSSSLLPYARATMNAGDHYLNKFPFRDVKWEWILQGFKVNIKCKNGLFGINKCSKYYYIR